MRKISECVDTKTHLNTGKSENERKRDKIVKEICEGIVHFCDIWVIVRVRVRVAHCIALVYTYACIHINCTIGSLLTAVGSRPSS